VGQVEPVLANVRDDRSVRAACMSAEAVVNCVGILAELGRNRFDAVQAEGAGRLARIAAEEGARRFVQISAIGADPDSDSGYARSKGEGERAVREAFPGAVILRPSIVFGAEDEFFNRFAGMARMSPVIPVVGPNTRFQPVWVDDVAHAAAKAVEGEAAPGIYELGGPDVASFRDLLKDMLRVVRRRRLVIGVPFFLARIMGWGLDLIPRVTAGTLSNAILTADQVRQLGRDNVVTGEHPGFEALGIEPTAMEAILPTYLWRFRKGGQYAEIQDSARNLKV
jgi:NADH dehydrogenase